MAGRVLVALTSDHVRGETWTFLDRRYCTEPAVAFLGLAAEAADRFVKGSARFRDGDFAAAGFVELRVARE